MKLAPVYLLPPEPDDRIKLSRRKFVAVAAGLFAGGAALGVLGGHALWGMAGGDAPPVQATATGPVPARLQWAREVARGPVEALAREAPAFVAICDEWYDDKQLAEGLRRLVVFVATDRDAPDRRTAAGLVLRHLARFPTADESITAHLPALRRLVSR